MYEYKPAPKLRYVGPKRLVTIAWVCALLLIPLLYFTVTGKVASEEQQQTLKSNFQDDIAAISLEKEACASALQESKASAESCSKKLGVCDNDLSNNIALLKSAQNDLSVMKGTLSECEARRTAAERVSADYENRMKTIAENAAKEICCRPGIGSINYMLENYNIICAGNNTVVC